MLQLLYSTLMLFMGSLLSTTWIKTRPARELLVRVKFTGNPYSYVCERPPLKYMQTRVCRNSYMGTSTVPNSYSCLCERSLMMLQGKGPTLLKVQCPSCPNMALLSAV